jgi:hypothetical protein
MLIYMESAKELFYLLFPTILAYPLPWIALLAFWIIFSIYSFWGLKDLEKRKKSKNSQK